MSYLFVSVEGAGSRRALSLILLVSGAVLISACNSLQMSSACPAPLQGRPLTSGDGIQWRHNANDPKPSASARITAVRVECIPIRHESTTTNNLKKDAYTDYEIAVTAEITYTVSAPTAFENITPFSSLELEASLIFEGISHAGVVLGSATTSFTVVNGGTTGTASAKIVLIHRRTRLQVKTLLTSGER